MTRLINIKDKINVDSILYFLIFFAIFFTPKLNFDIKIFYLDFSFIGYLSILAFILYKRNFNLLFFSKKILFFLVFFFILHFFFLSNIYDTKFAFLKQFLFFLILIFLFQNLKPSFNKQKFLEFYMKFSKFAVLSGYVVLIISFFGTKAFFEIKNGKNLLDYSLFTFSEALTLDYVDEMLINYGNDLTINIANNQTLSNIFEFFSITSPLRFQGFVNEPSTYSILIIPFFLICMNNFKKNKLISILTFFSILISKSLYGYIGLGIVSSILIYKILKKKQKFSILSTIILLSLSFGALSITKESRDKISGVSNNLSSIFNKGFDHKYFNKKIKDDYDLLINQTYSLRPEMTFKEYMQISYNNRKFYSLNQEKFKNFKKLKDVSFEDFKNLSNNSYLENTNTLPGEKNYIGASACSYLSNLFVIFKNYELIILGTGLGSHKKKYDDEIMEWHFIKANHSACFGLNSKDSKSIYLRLLSEAGIIILLPFLLSLSFFSRKKEMFQNTNIYNISFLYFTIKCLQIGKYFDLSLVMFYFMLINSIDFKKNIFSKIKNIIKNINLPIRFFNSK